VFKPHPIEFLQSEFDALAAEVGKLANEVEFFFTEEVIDGVAGRVLGIKQDTAQSAAPAAEPVAPAAAPEAAPAAEQTPSV